MSSTVSKALTFSSNPEVSETAKFTMMFDRFFDCLNVTNFDAGKHNKKDFQKPYLGKDDKQIEVPYIIVDCISNDVTLTLVAKR